MYENDEELREIYNDIEEINEEIETLKRDSRNSSASISGSGENVTLNGTAEAEFKIPPLPEGNTEQEQLSGKNLFDFDYILQHKNDFVKDGQYFMFLQLDDKFKTQFTATTILKGTSQNLVMGFSDIIFSAGGNDKRTLNNGTVVSPKTFDFTNATNVYVFFANSSTIGADKHEIDDIYNNYNVQVEFGSTATSYEPFCGGIPSPNPDYPQAIKNVTGNANVKIQNKNLLNINRELGEPSNTDFDKTAKRFFNYNTYVKGITGANNYSSSAVKDVVIEDNNVSFTTVNGYYGLGFPIKVKPNTNYYFSVTETLSTSVVRIMFYDKEGTFINNVVKGSFTTPNNCNCILVFLTGSQAGTTYNFTNLQIEEGTAATPWVPYKNEQYTVDLKSKNELNYDLEPENKYYDMNGQPVTISGAVYVNQTINLLANTTYTFSYEEKIGDASVRLCEYKEDGTFIKRTLIQNNNVSIKLNSETSYVIISTNKAPTSMFIKPQLEEGSEATDYEPYYNIIAMEGTTLQDDGFHQLWDEYIFTGNENWIDYQGTQTGDFYKFYTTGVKLGRTNSMEAKENAYCTHFINDRFYANDNGIGLTQNATYISINKTIVSTANELKTFFATQYNNGNPVKVQYIKATATVIPYKGVQQAQYNAIKKAISYSNVTHVSGSSDEADPIFNVKTYRDMNSSLENLESRIELLEGRS